METGSKRFSAHLDGYNFLPNFKGQVDSGPRKEFFFLDDNTNLNAVRFGPWKIHFSWIEGNLFTSNRTNINVPLVINLRRDPYECTPFESDWYRPVQAEKLWTLIPAQAIAGKFIRLYKEYPQPGDSQL